ncbi:MAG: germination protein YpeB [Clostridia bacterium]|nr:MAG: germination protein YpeB [Clostridia bacterium]
MRRWTIALAALGIGIILLVGWALSERSSRLAAANAVEADYQREFYDLLSNTEQTEVLLAKTLAANSARQHIFYLTEVWNHANAAQASMAKLPVTNVNLSASRKFLSQVSDYCYSLARQVASGRDVSPREWGQLTDFHTRTGEMARDLHATEAKMTQTNFRWTAAMGGGVRGRVHAADDPLQEFARINQRLEQLPAMIYDGPFSDARLEVKPRGLTGSQISLDQAKKTAVAMVDVPGRNDYHVTRSDRLDNAPIKTYSFSLDSPSRPGPVNLDISQKGGHLVWLRNNRLVSEKKISLPTALEKARAYLARHGYGQMELTGSMEQGNTLIATFAYANQGVIHYPDQVKVMVALDNGQVTGLEASTYLTNHHPRNLPRPRLNPAQVKDGLSPRLVAERTRLALIPLPSGQEALTYETRARLKQDEFLVYVNALTGEEEQILKVIKEPGGEITM